MDILKSLKKYFGFDSFRKGQDELVENILKGNDVLGVLPTGGGKSICYQLPALMLDGICLVISPLISLMKDQVDSLKENGIKAEFINSSQDIKTYTQTLRKIKRNEKKKRKEKEKEKSHPIFEQLSTYGWLFIFYFDLHNP